MNFWALELHPDRKIFPIGKTVYKDDYPDDWLRYIVGFSYEDGVKLHVIERYVERKEEKTYRDSIKNSLLSEYPQLEKVIVGDDVFRADSSVCYPMKYCQDISLFYEFINGGLEIPEELKYEDWEHLALYSYYIECEKMPESCNDIELVYRKKPKYSFVEWEIPLKIGEPYDFSLESGGRTIQCYINNVHLLDFFDEIEKQCSDPRVIEAYSAEQIAEMKRKAIEAAEEHCSRDMRYAVIEYECDDDSFLNFDFTSHLNEEIKVIMGDSTSFTFIMSAKPDKEYGTHGLPLKAAVIQHPVPESVTEISVELFYIFSKNKI